MSNLNILYIHGFGSRVNPNADKQIALRTIADVEAFAPDYSRAYQDVLADVEPFLAKADLLVGTSMGGFLVSRLSEQTGKPFVSINPLLQTRRTLTKYLGDNVDHYGRAYTLTEEALAGYPDFLPSKQGIVLLDLEDEVIDSRATVAALQDQMPVHVFEGGNHRFAHINESLPLMLDLVRSTQRTKNS